MAVLDKACSQCKISKPLIEFGTDNKNNDGYRASCKTCFNKNRKNHYYNNRENPEFVARIIIKKCKERLKQKRAREIRQQTGKEANVSEILLTDDDFNIDVEWVLNKRDEQQNKCAYSGMSMQWSIGYIDDGKRLNPYVVSIDRIDSSRGYTKDNCALVCWKSNCFKSDGDLDEMLEFATAIELKLTVPELSDITRQILSFPAYSQTIF